MRLYTSVYVVLTTVAIEVWCDCGILPLNTNPLLMPRNNIESNIFPWTVYIDLRSSPRHIPKCAGTLISSSVVITAAHCFNYDITGPTLDDLSNFTVFTERRDPPYIMPGRDVQESKIKTMRTAVGFKGTAGYYNADIAWIILENPFNLTTSVSPACLDMDNRLNEELFQNMRGGQVMSWRETTNGSKWQTNKMYITLYPHGECLSMTSGLTRAALTVDEFCARFLNETKIFFDNGGGFYSQHNGRWYLRGVMSKATISVLGSRWNIFLPVINVGSFVGEIIGNPAVKKCGMTTSPANPMIARGFQAELGQFPWHVAIYKKISTRLNSQICGGSLISSNVVISAAHCFYDDTIRQKQDASHFTVAAGKRYQEFNWPERFVQKSAVDTIHLSSRYVGEDGVFAADIAWLILQTPLNFTNHVAPICLSRVDWQETELQIEQNGKVAGWGYTADDSPSHELQAMYARFIPYLQCLSAVPPDFAPYITIDKFCAGHLNGTSLCNGDSGGGLVFQRNDRWYLRGVVSVGPRNTLNKCNTNSYTAFVDVGRYFGELHKFTNITPYDLI